jgi:DNA polymerase III subunit gamma/tau
MPYEVTATRKRPQTFSELVGQEFVAATLTSSIAQGRIAHAYLFAGPRGVGKTSVARILAKALNCATGPTAEPCGACPSCAEIARGASLDVIEIDGASNTSVNDVREIRDEVLFAPNSSRYKVYIIDEVHMLSNSAFNALLKTIEEPPPYIVFIFATTEVHKVPATIRSRCQQYNFRLISTAEIKAKLQEASRELSVQAEERALTWIAREATGSLRDAYTLLDQVVSFSAGEITLEKIREKLGVLGIDEMNDFVRLLRAGDPAQVLERLDAVLATGVSVEQLVSDLAEYFRNLLFLKSGITRDTLLGYAPTDFDADVLARLTAEQIEKAIEMLLALYRTIRFSLSQRFELELVLVRLAALDRLISPADIMDALREARGSATTRPQAGPAQPRREPGPMLREPSRPAQPAAAPRPAGAVPATASAPQNGPAAAPIPAVEPGKVVPRLIEAIRRDSPALASALEKCIGSSVDEGDLLLTFQSRDRFAGELVLKEKDSLGQRASALLARPVRLRVAFQEARVEQARVDQRVELLRKVFRGEVVKGEGRGTEPV